jgi:hypothetical protein
VISVPERVGRGRHHQMQRSAAGKKVDLNLASLLEPDG